MYGIIHTHIIETHNHEKRRIQMQDIVSVFEIDRPATLKQSLKQYIYIYIHTHTHTHTYTHTHTHTHTYILHVNTSWEPQTKNL